MVSGIYFTFPIVWLVEQVENNSQSRQCVGSDSFVMSAKLNFLLATLCETLLLSATNQFVMQDDN